MVLSNEEKEKDAFYDFSEKHRLVKKVDK